MIRTLPQAKKTQAWKLPTPPGAITESAPGDVAPRNGYPDPRMFRALPFTGKILRGYIREYNDLGPRGEGRVDFLYNPNTISYDFQVNGSLIGTDQQHPVATRGMIGGNGMSFSLLFSRQFEVAYGGDLWGVHRDLDALKYCVGITSSDTGFMIQKTNMFVMGAHASMIFYGFIDQMTVEIGYFSEKMVPMFAQVSLHATYVPPLPNDQLHWEAPTSTTNQDAAAALADSTAPKPKVGSGAGDTGNILGGFLKPPPEPGSPA